MTIGKFTARCITCERHTVHAMERHHSAEILPRCQVCGTWSLMRIPRNLSQSVARRLHRNPIADELREAQSLARDFSGHRPSKITRIPVKNVSRVRLDVGKVTGIMYLARRDGRAKEYLHRFAPGSRPSLTVTPDGKRLELLGGAFRFTERGIVDRPTARRKKST